MPFILKKMVIHKLRKEENTTSADVNYSDQCVALNGIVNDLHGKLIHAFNRDSYSEFDDSQEQVFPSQLTGYLDSRKEETDFVVFTKSALTLLRTLIETIVWAKGGFFVFSEFEDEGSHNIGIFTVRDTQGTIFVEQPTEHLIKVEATKYVNTDKLVMACLINTTDWIAGKTEFLTINSPRDVSQYYFNWLGAIQPPTTKDYTDRYYSLLNVAKLPIDTVTNVSLDRDTFKKLNYEFINSQPEKKVNIDDISNHFYGDSNYLTDLAYKQRVRIPSEFKASSESLRKFKFINIEKDGIRLRFNRGDFEYGAQGKIRFNENNPNQVIITSPDFAEALRQALK